MLVPKELVAWWVKHHSLRLHVLFNRKNNNNNNSKASHVGYAGLNKYNILSYSRAKWQVYRIFTKNTIASVICPTFCRDVPFIYIIMEFTVAVRARQISADTDF